jgi:transketolase
MCLIAVIGVDTVGSSAPGAVVMEHYGFTVENVCKQAHHVLDQFKVKASCT